MSIITLPWLPVSSSSGMTSLEFSSSWRHCLLRCHSSCVCWMSLLKALHDVLAGRLMFWDCHFAIFGSRQIQKWFSVKSLLYRMSHVCRCFCWTKTSPWNYDNWFKFWIRHNICSSPDVDRIVENTGIQSSGGMRTTNIIFYDQQAQEARIVRKGSRMYPPALHDMRMPAYGSER